MQVHTVLVTLQHPGTVDNAIYRGDLVFQADTPVLVLEWSGERGASDPRVSVPLNKGCLAKAEADDAFDYVHDDPVTDPRAKPAG